MADLLTVYDDEESNTFIDCTMCEKRIRGDTNYKIHLTTLQHLKRERTLADKGLIPMPAPLPHWDNIKDYLTYLNLNEPIIGLGDLVQEQDFLSKDGSVVLRYRCRLCSVQMDLYEMVAHVVGRRHRQKYLVRYRSDVVTWEKTSEKQAGVLARAKAAIVEKQEGWGNPVPLIRSDERRSVNNRANNGAAHHRASYPQDRSSFGRDRREQDIYSRSYKDGDDYGRQSHYHEDKQYNHSYRDDVPQHSSAVEDNRYDQSYRDDIPHRPSVSGNSRYDELYREDVPHRSSSLEKNQYDQPYRDDVPHHSSTSGDDQYDAQYSQDGRQRSFYQETDYMERPYLEDEINVRAFPRDGTNARRYMDKGDPQPYHDERYSETNPSRESYKIRETEDYHGNRSLSYPDTERKRFEDVDETGRQGSFEMQGYKKREGYFPREDDMPSKKKRKSRFSDASPLEMAHERKRQIEDFKQTGRPGPLKNQASGNIMDSAVTPRMENVLDVLNDIQIENVQEANFLKDKLCTLLKEFQSNKVQRIQGQISQASADFTDIHYGVTRMEQCRDVPESRCLDDQSFQEPSRYNRDLQAPREYFRTRHVEEDRKSLRQLRGPEEPEYQWDSYRERSAGHSEELMIRHSDDRREGAWNLRPLRDEERLYAEEHRYQHDYRSGGDPYDPFQPSSSPPLEATSSTLDKLASTLLELVARKKN